MCRPPGCTIGCRCGQSAASIGQVGVAQSELIGQLAANPRLDPETLHRGAWELFIDALELPYKEFEANVRKCEKLADAEGAEAQAELNRQNRDADIKRRKNGSWDLSASFDDVGGVEFAEIFGHYVQAEWDADWAEARERVGDCGNDVGSASHPVTTARGCVVGDGTRGRRVPAMDGSAVAARQLSDRRRHLSTRHWPVSGSTRCAIATWCAVHSPVMS